MGIDIHSLISHNFQENIAYFQKKHPLVFQKLQEFELALEKQYYHKKYTLVYEENAFDIIENSSSISLYNKQAHHFAALATKGIHLDTQNETFQLLSDPLPQLSNFFNTDKQKEHLVKSFAKIIFFGVGLGIHLEDVAKKISAQTLLIVEDDLELFHTSLYTINYAKLAHNYTLYFSIFEEKNIFEQTAQSFIDDQKFFNAYIKFFAMLHHNEEKIKIFHLLVASQASLRFSYTDLLKENIQAIKNIDKGYSFLSKTASLEHINKPFILLAAGPSLEKNIEWIKQHQDSFYIVAISALLAYLEKLSIKVDIIIHLDAMQGANIHFQKVQSFSYFQNSLVLCSSKTPESILQHFQKEQLLLFEVGTKYHIKSLKPAAPCIGSLSLQLLLLLRIKKIFLLGLDLAIDKQSGATHSASHSYKEELSLNAIATEQELIDYKHSLVSIEGNLTQEMFTTPHFLTSIDSINFSTQFLKHSFQKIFNLSDGAKFTNVQTLEIKKIDLKKIQKSPIVLKHIDLNKQDIQNLQMHLSVAHDLYIQLSQYPKVSTQNQLIKQLKEIYFLIHKDIMLSEYEIYKVLDLYIQTLFIQVFDRLNHYNKKTEIQKLHSFILNDMKKMIKTYTTNLERVCKKI